MKQLLSSEHFLIDGTLIQPWTSMKSIRRTDGTDQPPDRTSGEEGRRQHATLMEQRMNARLPVLLLSIRS